MNNIISLSDRRPGKFVSGMAICLSCRNVWAASAPAGTQFLECPNCETIKGVFKFPIEHEGEHWQCLCGNWYFLITPKRIYCPNCGEDYNP
jgi:hypothetical protein